MTESEQDIRIRDLEDRVDSLFKSIVDLNGRRFTNASHSVQATDFVTRMELEEVRNAIPPEPDPPAEAVLTTGKRFPKVVITGKNGIQVFDSTGTLLASFYGAGTNGVIDADFGYFTNIEVTSDVTTGSIVGQGGVYVLHLDSKLNGGTGAQAEITMDSSGASATMIHEIDGATIFRVDSGGVRFGTHTGIGAETVTGFLTIKDIGGNTRKIAVVS